MTSMLNPALMRCTSRRGLRVAMFASALLLGLAPAPASEHAPAKKEHGAAAEAEGEAVPESGPFSLGEFEVAEFHPTHKQVPHIKFAAFLVVDEKATPAQRSELAHWQRRARDQAIIAVRSAEPYALAEPGLDRIRRRILLRVKRMPLPVAVVDVYLTEFEVTESH